MDQNVSSRVIDRRLLTRKLKPFKLSFCSLPPMQPSTKELGGERSRLEQEQGVRREKFDREGRRDGIIKTVSRTSTRVRRAIQGERKRGRRRGREGRTGWGVRRETRRERGRERRGVGGWGEGKTGTGRGKETETDRDRQRHQTDTEPPEPHRSQP